MYNRPELVDLLSQMVRHGKVFELGHMLEPGIPHHPLHPPFMFSLGRMHGDMGDQGPYSSANEIFCTGGHTGTHLDALGHISCDGRIFGDEDVASVQDKHRGLSTHGIDATEPILMRGVLLDVARARQRDMLDHAYTVTPDDLESALQLAQVKLKPGDAVLIRTGWAQNWATPRKFTSRDRGTPGVGLDGARWLVEQGMALTGSDTMSYEVMPSTLPVHRYLLVEQGVQIMECLNLEELSETGCYEFLFACLPLRIRGGTGSPIRPIAIC